jgi:hypothetical protein
MRSGSDQRPSGRYNSNKPFQQPQRSPQRNQGFQSNGPDVKIRGSAHQIFERYVALAREATIGGDRVAAENLYQHAEHFFRVNNESRGPNPQGAPRPASNQNGAERSQPGWEDEQPRSDTYEDGAR